jgi:hypothetical protein
MNEMDMPESALPCLVCGRALRNIFPGQVANQPRDGVACLTSGNYGSTLYDPMDGSRLEFNICDECLCRAGEQGRVYVVQDHVPVEFETWGVVGWAPAEYEPVPWHPGLIGGYGEDASIYITADDLRAGLPVGIHLRFSVADLLAMSDDPGSDTGD